MILTAYRCHDVAAPAAVFMSNCQAQSQVHLDTSAINFDTASNRQRATKFEVSVAFSWFPHFATTQPRIGADRNLYSYRVQIATAVRGLGVEPTSCLASESVMRGRTLGFHIVHNTVALKCPLSEATVRSLVAKKTIADTDPALLHSKTVGITRT